MERKEDLLLLGFRRKKSKAVCPAPKKVKALCRDRASKRWSALLTQTKSRIGYKCGMRKRLGEANWAAFVGYAEAEYKTAFLRAFTPASGDLCCHGKLDGGPCPKRQMVDLKTISTVQCEEELAKLHLDHTYDVERICKVWTDALPEEPEAWDEGLCGPLVAHLLFGTTDHVMVQCSARPIWRKQLHFRCGTVRGVKGQRAADFCHDLVHAHDAYPLEVKDIAWPK
jgi:hypothetical protein